MIDTRLTAASKMEMKQMWSFKGAPQDSGWWLDHIGLLLDSNHMFNERSEVSHNQDYILTNILSADDFTR